MGYGTLSNRYGAWVAEKFSAGPQRTAKEGRREEDYQTILASGDTSGEDWDRTIQTNLKQLKKNYAPRGDFNVKGMHKTDKYLWDATFGSTKAGDRAVRKANLKAPVLQTTTTSGVKPSGGGYVPYSTKVQQSDFAAATEKYQSDIQAIRGHQRRSSMAKWIGAYNKMANIGERTTQSQRRMVHRERFAQMKVQSQEREERGGRAKLKAGISSLVMNLSGSGLNI
jgi:hypothetical protein